MRATNRFRADVEGLRAVGVLAVVAYHAGLGAVGGGFVGVDVFYVLGGGVRRLVLAVEAGGLVRTTDRDGESQGTTATSRPGSLRARGAAPAPDRNRQPGTAPDGP